MRSTKVSVGKQKSQCIWMKRNEVTRESELKEEAGSAEHEGLRGKAKESMHMDEAERSYAGIRIEGGGRECGARRSPWESRVSWHAKQNQSFFRKKQKV